MTLELAWPSRDSAFLTRILEQVQLTHEREGARAAVARLIELVGVRPPIRGGAYYDEALHYYLGLLYAELQRPEEAAEQIRLSAVPPAAGGQRLFADHVRDGLELMRQRNIAQARGMPSFLIASMPRAASATLTQTIAGMLDLPRFRISLDKQLLPSWLDAVSPGGAMLHDHFTGSPFNMEVLRRGGVREVFVLIRDPRAAAASAFALLQKRTMAAPLRSEDYEQGVLKQFLNQHGPWLQGWIDAAAQAGGVAVHWIDSVDVRTDMPAVWRQFQEVLGGPYPALHEYPPSSLPAIRANFVQGDDDAWRKLVGPATQARMWEALSPAARELVRLKP